MSEEYRLYREASHVDWSIKETVDNLTEALHYFAELQRQRGRKYDTLNALIGGIMGSKGKICNIVDMKVLEITRLHTLVTERYRYYVLYNRRYLEYGDRMFERASHMHGKWQTVHKKVVDQAVLEGMVGLLRDHVCIVIIMQDKTDWYINPSKMKRFAFEWETETIHDRTETDISCSVPISREHVISRIDPFIPIPSL